MADFMATISLGTGRYELTLAIVMMALITFTVRYAFFTRKIDIKLNDTVKTMLTFTAPCVLTAMFVPIMFQAGLPTLGEHGAGGNATGGFMDILHSSYFWAGVFAIVCSVLTRHTMLVIILSMAVFYGLRFYGL